MAGSGSALEPASGWRPASAWTAASAYRVRDDRLESSFGDDAMTLAPNSAARATPDGGAAQGVGGLTDLPVKVRLLGSFALVAVVAVAVAAVMSLALGDVRQALPEGLPPDAAAAIKQELVRARMLGLGLAGFAVVTGFVLAVLQARAVAGPVTRITEAMDRLAAGETDVALPAADSADEIGRMARAIGTFRDNAREVQRLQRERAEQQRREEDARQRQRQDMASELERVLDRVVGSVQGDIETMQREAQELLDARTQADQRIGDVNAATQTAHQLTESFAQSASELTRAIGDIEGRINQASEMSQKVSRDAQSTDETIQKLVEAADAITEIIDMIRDIAKRTNLLALNATVEAKRAGEYGKSFSVVASEIQKLSRRTNEATEHVETHISDIKRRTDETAQKVRGIIDGVNGINESAAEISSVMEQQARSAQQISDDVNRTRDQIETVRQSVEVVKEASQKAAETSKQVQQSADKVAKGVQEARGEVSGFLDQAVKQT